MKVSLQPYDVQNLVRRLPKKVIAILQSNPVFVAGGYIRSVIANEPVNDIDVFCASKEAARYVAEQLARQTKGTKVIETENAYTVTRVRGRLSVQFIHRWTFNNPYDCVDSFDFTIACAALWWKYPAPDNSIPGCWQSAADPNFYPDLAAKRLVYRAPIRNEEAGGSLLRVLKFYQRGYRIPLDSFGAVLARLVSQVDVSAPLEIDGHADIIDGDERRWAKVITGLLREVDPQVDPNHEAHLPAAA